MPDVSVESGGKKRAEQDALAAKLDKSISGVLALPDASEGEVQDGPSYVEQIMAGTDLDPEVMHAFVTKMTVDAIQKVNVEHQAPGSVVFGVAAVMFRLGWNLAAAKLMESLATNPTDKEQG
jgi:hypothetical protein